MCNFKYLPEAGNQLDRANNVGKTVYNHSGGFNAAEEESEQGTKQTQTL